MFAERPIKTKIANNIFFRIKLLVTHLFHSRIAPGVRFTVQFAEELLTFVRLA